MLTGNDLTLVSGNWVDILGVQVGSNVTVVLGGTEVTTVTSVNGAVMTIATVVNLTDGIYDAGSVTITDDPESFNMNFNLCVNGGNISKYSVIDGEVNSLECVLVNALIESGSTDTLIQTGNKSGGYIQNPTIKRIADVNGLKRFEVELDFLIWTSLNLDVYNYDQTIGDYVEFYFLTEYQNNQLSIGTTSFANGNVGSENENFKGHASDFVLNTIDWTDENGDSMHENGD